MKLENLQRIATDGYAFDTETHKVQRGLIAPPLVCGSVAQVHGELLTREGSVTIFQALLDGKSILLFANAPFDNLVMAVYALEQGIDLIPAIFEAYEEERMYCVLLAEQLHALAEGHLGKDPTGRHLKSYSLESVTKLVLGRDDAKVNDRWRPSYYLLEDIPQEEWPDDARTYPVDDVINTWEVAVAQAAGRNRNLHDLARQAYADWALRLGAAWGFNIDPAEIIKVKAETQSKKLAGQDQFLSIRLLKTVKEKGLLVVKKNGKVLKKMVADAYGCSGICYVCDGRGGVPGATKCPTRSCGGEYCTSCWGTGFKPKGCKACDSTGYDLDSVPMPRTETGLISSGRDTLYETGNESLIDFAAWGEQDKILTTYIPWLEKGIAEDGTLLPLNPRPTVLKETGRIGASTEHQLPREGGIRECIVARPGWLLGSCDWEGAELVTHGQSCLNLVGWSKMADALNSGVKVHDKLAAEIIGVEYEHMVANRKTDKRLGDVRQAAKPPNFGFPGLMGAATLCLQQRKQGPDTTGPDGRKYKGLRFCILAGGAQACGMEKMAQWKGRDIAPMCLACLETADSIRDVWLETWPENTEYFEIVKRIHASGEMTQHWSGRVRAGMTLCATANGFFQGMAGDMMKLAICRMSYEMYVKKSSDLYGARLIIPIHDEAFFEARKEQASAAAKRVSTIMVEAMQEICPGLAPAAKAEPALMERWYKDAEPVWSPEGELLVWKPIQGAAL